MKENLKKPALRKQTEKKQPEKMKPEKKKPEKKKPEIKKPEIKKPEIKMPEKAPVLSCPVERKCGGCSLLYMPYAKQLAKKQRIVEDLILDFCPVEPILGMKDPYHYRNKVNATFAYTRDRKIVSGIYQEGTHRVVPVESCLIEDETADAVILRCGRRDYPVIGIYRKTILPVLEMMLREKDYRMKDLLSRIRTRYHVTANEKEIFNVNTPEDLETIRILYESGQ